MKFKFVYLLFLMLSFWSCTEYVEVHTILKAKECPIEEISECQTLLNNRAEKYGLDHRVELRNGNIHSFLKVPKKSSEDLGRLNTIFESAQLRFYETYRFSNPFIEKAFIDFKKPKGLFSHHLNQHLKDHHKNRTTSTENAYTLIRTYTAADANENNFHPDPSFDYQIRPNILGTAFNRDSLAILKSAVYAHLKNHIEDIRLEWSEELFNRNHPDSLKGFYSLYLLRESRDSREITENGLIRAEVDKDTYTGLNVIYLQFDDASSEIWYEMTARARDNNRAGIAICVNDEVLSCPSVNEAIIGGRSAISTNDPIEEVFKLSTRLRYGSLPCVLNIMSQKINH